MSLKPPQADAQGKGKLGGEGPQRLYLWGACPPRWQLDVFQGWKVLTGLFLSSTFIWLASLLSGWVFSPSLSLFTFLSNTLMSGSTLLMIKSKCLLVRASRKRNKTKQKTEHKLLRWLWEEGALKLSAVKAGKLHQLFQSLCSLHIPEDLSIPKEAH